MNRIRTTHSMDSGMTLRAYKPGYGYTKLDVIDNGIHFFAVACTEEFNKVAKDGEAFEIYIWLEDIGAYEFKSSLIGRVTVGDPILLFNHTKEISRCEERKCLRADVSMPFRFFLFDPAKFSKNFSSEKPVFHEATITLLSDREIIFTSNEKLEPEVFLKGHVTLDNKDVEIVGKVHKASDKDEGTYLLNLTGMHEKDRLCILNYVFYSFRE